MRLEISQQQQQHQQHQHQQHTDEMEAVYRQHQHQQQQAASHWLSGYAQLQQRHHEQQQQQQQQHYAQHQQHLQQLQQHAAIVAPSQWISEFDALKHPQLRAQLPHSLLRPQLPMLMQPSMLPFHQQQHYSVLPLLPAQMQQPPPAQADKIVELKDGEAQAAARNVTELQEAEMVNDFSSAEAAQQSSASASAGEQGLAGGLSAEMIDRLMNSDDPKWRNSRFLRFISRIRAGEIEFRDNQAVEKQPAEEQTEQTAGEAWAEEYGRQEQQEGDEAAAVNAASFPSGWAEDFEQREGLRPLSTAEGYAKMAAGWSDDLSAEREDEAVWESEYRRIVRGEEKAEVEVAGEVDEAAWQRALQQHDEFSAFSDIDWRQALEKAKQELRGGEAAEDPQYRFTQAADELQQAAAYSDASAAFEEGVRLLAQGELRGAIAAFESAVQLEPEHSEAWCYLGSAQAENEEESNAIAALLRAVAVDPYNLRALMMLGVSYTNDLEEHRALSYLKTWLENNPDYQQAALASSAASVREYQQFYGDSALHDQVTAMFLSAVQLRPQDAELHTVMGVLYHLSSDFDKAVDAFKTAIKLRPDDAQLWNKLGATLANSSRSADAVHAYQRALSLRPRYVRALANLAISYANQGLHDDAVAVYLRCLACNADAQHVWSYLRISLSHLGKEQLVELTHSRNPELFRPYYDF